MRVEPTFRVLLVIGVLTSQTALHAEEPAEPACNALCQRWMHAGQPKPRVTDDVTGSVPAPAGDPLEIAPAPAGVEEAPKRRRSVRPPARVVKAEALRPNALTAAVVPGRDGGYLVKLAWLSPPWPGSAQFFIEMRALIGGTSKELLTRVSPEKSASVAVPGNASRLYWRVSGMYPQLHRYATADWQAIDILPATSSLNGSVR